MTDKTINELLSEFGITHQSKGEGSAHELFIGDASIGWYDAGAAVKLLTALREYAKSMAGKRIPEQLGTMDW